MYIVFVAFAGALDDFKDLNLTQRYGLYCPNLVLRLWFLNFELRALRITLKNQHFNIVGVVISFNGFCRNEGVKKEDGGKEEMESLPSGVQGLGMGLPDMRTKKKGKNKVAKEDHVAEALDKLREQTRETVKGLESLSSKQLLPPGSSDDAMVEDWIKQFEDLTGSQVNYQTLTYLLLFVFSIHV